MTSQRNKIPLLVWVIIALIALFGAWVVTNYAFAKSVDSKFENIARGIEADKSSAAPATTLEAVDFDSFSPSLARFTDLAEGQSYYEAIDALRLHSAREQGESMINTNRREFTREDGSVLIYTTSNLPDDSISAEQFYVIFTGTGDDREVAAFAGRIKCARGSNTLDWQTDLCP